MTWKSDCILTADHVTYTVVTPDSRATSEGPREDFDRIRSEAMKNAGVIKWPRIEQAESIEDGQAIAVLLRESDGSISAIRISVEQLAD